MLTNMGEEFVYKTYHNDVFKIYLLKYLGSSLGCGMAQHPPSAGSVPQLSRAKRTENALPPNRSLGGPSGGD